LTPPGEISIFAAAAMRPYATITNATRYDADVYLVPASIVTESSSDDVIVKEGDTVVLTCNATGIPQPEVTWYRRSSLAFKLGHHARRQRQCNPVVNDLLE